MPVRKSLLLLANSNKQGGRCLAGRFIERKDDGGWVVEDWCRPVYPDGNGHDAIPIDACDNLFPLDLVSLELDHPTPVDGQPENWRWSSSTTIDLVHTFNTMPGSLAGITETPGDLWLDPAATRPDEVTARHPISRSLYLIQARDLWLSLFHDQDGRKRIHAEFVHVDKSYEHIPVTDPLIFRILYRQFPPIGQAIRFQLRNGDNYWITVSLGLPFGPRSARYKFVAAIIDHTGYLQRTYR